MPLLCFDSNFDLATDTWYHFAVVVGPGGNTGYLNGLEMTDRHYNFGGPTTRRFFSDVPNKQVLWLGRGRFAYGTDEQYHNGAIDEVRIYSRSLSADDIGAYYSWMTAPLAGDINGDGHVDMLDLLKLAESWARSEGESGYNSACDLTGDKHVDVVDLLMLADDFGKR